MERLAKYLRGWLAYFKPARSLEWRREQDKWLRHRLRAIRLRQTRRGSTTYDVMRGLGLSGHDAAKVASHRGSWWGGSFHAINKALPISYFDKLGLPHVSNAPARNHSNRRMRTRMSGGVAGAGPD